MSTRTNNSIEQLRASLADEPEVWSRPLRLLAEALLAHCDEPAAGLISPQAVPAGCLAVEDLPTARPYLAHLVHPSLKIGVFRYLSGDDDDVDWIESWWPSWPPGGPAADGGDLPKVRIIATGLKTSDDVREAIRRHKRCKRRHKRCKS